MKSLNTYNYREELYMKPISYQVTVSDNDKVIKIEDDGALIAELSFDVDGNTLFLNGKDGLEVAQVELPISLASIVKQQYNAETKEIELSILKTNGETTVFGLDVAELVNVYTAGDGIDITDNMISIKIKDEKGPLHVDKHGLCIDMNTLATSDDVEQINSEIEQIKTDVSTLTEHVNTSIDTINTNMSDGFNSINTNMSTGFEAINSALATETEERIAADAAIQEQIGNVTEGLEGSIADAITDIQEQIGNVTEGLEGSIADAITQMQGELATETEAREAAVTDLNVRLENEIANREQQCNDIAASVDTLNTTVTSELETLNTELTNGLAEVNAQMSAGFSEINSQMSSGFDILNSRIDARKEEIEAEVARAEAAEEALQASLNDEITAREEGDLILQTQLGDGFMSAVSSPKARSFGGQNVTQKIQEIETNLSNEIAAREEGDNKTYNAVAVEKQERVSADTTLNTKIDTSVSDLAKSIKLEKDVNNNLKYTLYVNGVSAGELNIPEDNMIESVTYNPETQELTFNWKTSIPQDPTTVSLSGLVDVYTAGDGLSLEGSTFKVSVQHAKYVDIQENGSVEFVGVFQKREGTNWVYDLIGKNGENNGKIIDFTADYELYNQHIQETYAPLTYVDSQDNLVRTTLIGLEGDSEELDTLYGLRSAIAKSEEVMSAKIAEEQARAEAKETDLDAKIDATKSDLAGYVNQEIEKVNNTISINEEANTIAHNEMSQNIKANSDILASLTNGESTGIVDKLDKQFHEVTSGINENAFEGLIKSLMDRISVLENTINVLVGGAEVNGSVANVVANSLAEAKAYTDVKSVAALENAVVYANETFQVKGDYITEIDGKYITEEELEAYKYIDSTELTAELSKYYTKEVSDSKYQPSGNYLTHIDSEYITETELTAMGFAKVEYVDARDSQFLTKDMADLLYAVTDVNDRYVKTSELLSKGYATETYVQNAIPSLNGYATESYVNSQGFIKSIPSEYVTESELILHGFASKSELSSEIANTKLYVDNKTSDMLTKTDALMTYQQKGDYITEGVLAAKDYATEAYVDTKIYTLNEKLNNYQPIGDYVTTIELENKGYVNSNEVRNIVQGLGYATTQALNDGLNAKVNKNYADATYALKNDLEKHIESAFTANDLVEGDNIKLSRLSNKVQINVRLSDNYNVQDTFSQNLPKAGNTLDLVSERLSIAIQNLYDTTDGEVF